MVQTTEPRSGYKRRSASRAEGIGRVFFANGKPLFTSAIVVNLEEKCRIIIFVSEILAGREETTLHSHFVPIYPRSFLTFNR